MKINNGFRHAPCPTCKGQVVGRTDKRFCSIKCKNEHHRNARIQFKSRFQDMQKRLKRNIVILEGILGPTAKGMNIHKDALFKFGFDLDLNTRSFTKSDQIWFELGEYQYTLDSKNIVTVERMKNLSFYMPGFFERWEIEFPQGMLVDENWNPMNHQPSQQYFSRWNE